ncbi:MAG: phage virion morphogenesis protein [Bradyrhizobium sp.]|nr:phage virion morphogenesis protein [Bradyrhizobium sp.]
MREFSSMAAFATHLVEREVATVVDLQTGLHRAAKAIETSAKAEIGQYQQSVGPFPAWEALADSTEAEKARLGYEPDAPLLRTGDLRDSITHQVEGLDAAIGSEDQVMVYHEFGTTNMPPRPVLGPAAIHNKHRIEKILGDALVSGLVGGDAIHPGLGYGFETKD